MALARFPVDNLLISQTILELTMFKHHFTAYLLFKASILAIAAPFTGADAATCYTVAGLSLAFTPVVAWLESYK